MVMKDKKEPSTSDITDLEIVEGLLKVSDDAGDKLFRKYHKIVYRYCCLYLKKNDDELISDLLQEVFIKILTRIDTFDINKISKFRAWIITIVRNTVYDYLRSYQKSIEVNEDDSFWEQQSKQDAFFEDCNAGIDNEIIQRVLFSLSPLEKEVLLLSAEGLSLKEVSCLLGKTYTNIKKQASVARKKFRENYALIANDSENKG